MKGLFGKFNPSRGDLVFSRNGELLGIMANNTYCLVLHDFTAVATFQFGPDVRAQHTGETLSRLFGYVFADCRLNYSRRERGCRAEPSCGSLHANRIGISTCPARRAGPAARN